MLSKRCGEMGNLLSISIVSKWATSAIVTNRYVCIGSTFNETHFAGSLTHSKSALPRKNNYACNLLMKGAATIPGKSRTSFATILAE